MNKAVPVIVLVICLVFFLFFPEITLSEKALSKQEIARHCPKFTEFEDRKAEPINLIWMKPDASENIQKKVTTTIEEK
jgi:hypothetical protein